MSEDRDFLRGTGWMDHTLPIIDENGEFYRIPVDRQEDADILGVYWNAVKEFIEGRGSESLERFEGMSVRSKGKDILLCTDLDLIYELHEERDIYDTEEGEDWFYVTE